MSQKSEISEGMRIDGDVPFPMENSIVLCAAAFP